MSNQTSLIQPEQIEQVILLIRGQRVMLDRDLAALYGVTTGNLNKAVQRNPERFPPDFMFQLTADEAEALRFKFGSLKRGQHFKYLPQVFTQEGVAMLSSVLRSPRAVQVNIAIMRVFVRLRTTLALHKELAHKLAELERKIEGHDTSIRTLFDAIRELAAPPATPRREIGYHVKEASLPYHVKRKCPCPTNSSMTFSLATARRIVRSCAPLRSGCTCGSWQSSRVFHDCGAVQVAEKAVGPIPFNGVDRARAVHHRKRPKVVRTVIERASPGVRVIAALKEVAAKSASVGTSCRS
jgi:hypothetical protein